MNAPTASRRGPTVSALLVVIAFFTGDAAMIAVCAVVRAIVSAPAVRWLIATVIIAAGGYLLFGMPQILAWRRTSSEVALAAPDVRTRWASALLRYGGIVAFTAASLLGGPLAIGWYYGHRQHQRAYAYTALSAVILAAAWAAIYLGLLSL